MATKGKGKGKSDSKKSKSARSIGWDSIIDQLKAQGINPEDLCGTNVKGIQCKVIMIDLSSVECC